MAHLLKFDSTHGHLAHPITFGDDWMDVGKGKLLITHERIRLFCIMAQWILILFWNVQVSLTAGKRLLLI